MAIAAISRIPFRSRSAASARPPNTTSSCVVQDDEEDPPRVVCQTDRTFTTASEAGTSGIAFRSIRDGNGEIYSMDADGGNQTNLSNNPAYDDHSTWSPDGSRIAFTTLRSGDYEALCRHGRGRRQPDQPHRRHKHRRNTRLVATALTTLP